MSYQGSNSNEDLPASQHSWEKGVWWARVFPVEDFVLGSEANWLEIQIIRPEDK